MSKLLVDGATGSAELIEPLKKLGLPAEKARLEFGDLAFMGRGLKGAPLYVGIELKKINELVQSLCLTKRFQGHQLIGMVAEESGFDRRYLLIEGDYHSDNDGRAVVFRGKGRPKPLRGVSSAVVLEQELLNIQTRGGVWLRHVSTRRDTLRFILAAFRYWTDKDLDQHKSHLAVYAPDFDSALRNPASDFRKAIQILLPGIGLAVSDAVEQRVGPARSLRDQMLKAMGMSESEWAALEIPNRGGVKRFGASRAKDVMETWNARNK